MAAQSQGDSPYVAAMALMDRISDVEYRKQVQRPNREWVLRTYAQCLNTVRNPDIVEDYIKAYREAARTTG